MGRMGPGHTLMAMCSWMLMLMRSPLRPLMQHPWGAGRGRFKSREREPVHCPLLIPTVCRWRARQEPPWSVASPPRCPERGQPVPDDGQAGGLGPPEPQPCSTSPRWVLAASQPCPLISRLSLCRLPSSCPSFWPSVCPWALPTPRSPSSVSLKLYPCFGTRRLSGPGVAHPSRHSLPTVQPAPGAACMPGPPPTAAQGETSPLRCLLLRLAL